MTKEMSEVVVIDAVRTAFGRAGEKGIFWNTRTEDLCMPLLKALIERNPAVTPDMIEDSIWGVTNQVKEQGGTIGRTIPILAEWGWEIYGCSIDRMYGLFRENPQARYGLTTMCVGRGQGYSVIRENVG